MKHHRVRWTDTPLEHFVAGLFFVAAVAVLFPWGLKYSTEVRHLTDEQVIEPDAAREEMVQLLARVDQPGFTPAVAHQVIKRAAYIYKHTPWIPKSLLEKEKAKGFSELRVLETKHSSIFHTWAQIVQSARDKFRKNRAASNELFKLVKSDAELQALFDFHPVETKVHWDVIGENFWTKLPFAFVFAFLFFIAMIKARELNLAVELINPLSLILATATFPVSWLAYPYKDPQQQVSKVINVMGMAFSLLMSFGGVASAQTVKKGEKKKSSPYTLQLDNRVIVPIEGSPSTLHRQTFNGQRWLLEAVSTTIPEKRLWYNETGIGIKVVRTLRTTVNVIGIVSHDSTGARKAMLGIQHFQAGPIMNLATPVARVEKTLDGGPWSVAMAVNPFFKLGREGIRSRTALSPDVSGRKVENKPLSWSAGLGFAVFHRKGKGDRVEAAILRNSAHQWQVRGRLILNFAF